MKTVGKALAVGLAFETVVLGIAVVLGFIHIPRVYWSQLSIMDDEMMWLRIPIAVTQAAGAFGQSLYHGAWHRIHGEGESDPLHLFIIMFAVNAAFWSAMVFLYYRWRERRRRRNHLMGQQTGCTEPRNSAAVP